MMWSSDTWYIYIYIYIMPIFFMVGEWGSMEWGLSSLCVFTKLAKSSGDAYHIINATPLQTIAILWDRKFGLLSSICLLFDLLTNYLDKPWQNLLSPARRVASWDVKKVRKICFARERARGGSACNKQILRFGKNGSQHVHIKCVQNHVQHMNT